MLSSAMGVESPRLRLAPQGFGSPHQNTAASPRLSAMSSLQSHPASSFEVYSNSSIVHVVSHVSFHCKSKCYHTFLPSQPQQTLNPSQPHYPNLAISSRLCNPFLACLCTGVSGINRNCIANTASGIGSNGRLTSQPLVLALPHPVQRNAVGMFRSNGAPPSAAQVSHTFNR